MELVHKTRQAIASPDEVIISDIHIGVEKTDTIYIFTKAAKLLQREHPNLHYHIYNNSTFILGQLNKRLIDFGLVGEINTSHYESIQVPVKDAYSALMRQDAPLTNKTRITLKDLWEMPLIIS